MSHRPAPKALPDRKFAHELLRRLPRGYRIAYSTESMSSHPYVFDPDGNVVRDPASGVPIQIPGSTRNRNAAANVIARLRRAGIKCR